MSTQNDLINYQNVIKEANSLINEQIKLWGGVVSSIQQVGKVTPSSFVNAQKQVNEALVKSTELTEKQRLADIRLQQAREKAFDDYEKKLQAEAKAVEKAEQQKINARNKSVQNGLTTGASLYKQQQSEIAQQERKRISLERATAKALEQSRAYNQLQTSWRNAQKALADSIVTDGLKAQSTRKLQKEFNDLDKRIKQVDVATKNYSKNVGNYQSAFNGIGSLTSQLAGALGWAGAIGTGVAIAKSIYDTTKQLDVLNKSMQLGSKDAQAYASNVAFLNRVTEDYGLELITTSQAYNKFYIAAKNKLALEDIQLIFDKVSKSASLMGLSIYDQEGIFKALEQMMSKGTVQAEELRGQLGDRLPGAFEIMANAMGVSTAKLGEMMKEGKVMASEVLPKFAIELEKAFGADKVNRVENLTAAENRMKNAWTDLISEINGSGNAIGDFATGFLSAITSMIQGINRMARSWKSIWDEGRDQSETAGYESAMLNYMDFDKFENQRNKAFKDRQKFMADEKKLIQQIKDGEQALAAAEKRRIMPNWLGGSIVTKDANENLEKLNKQLGETRGRIKAIEDLYKDWKNPEVIPAGKEETEAEKKKREAAERKAAKEALKSAKELLKSQYEANKSKLELEKESSRIADEISAKEIQIATLTRDYKKQLVDLEVKDKATATQQKIAIENEYAKEVAKVTEKMADDYGDDFTEQYKEVVKHVDEVTKAFDKTTESIDQTIQKGRELKADLDNLGNEIAIESLGGNRGSEYWNARTQQLEDWYENQKNIHQDNAQELLRIDKEYELQNLQLLNDRKNAFKQAMTEMYSSALGEMGAGSLAQFFNGQFEEIWAGAETLQEKMAAVMMAIGQIANDVFNAMSERQNAYFDMQFKNLETEKDLAIKFAGDNTSGREAIERQYEEKKRALQMQQARQQKQMAMLQATINIAQGITSALAQSPPYSFILAALVGVLGAVQLAKISSIPLPQFYTGTSNAPEGLALTQEIGAEMITDKHGNIKTLGNNKGAQLTYLNKGDKVFTADETTQKLNELLISSGVSPIVNVSGGNGLTEEQMRNIMQDTLAKQPKNITTLDRMGFQLFQEENNKRKMSKNRIVKIG